MTEPPVQPGAEVWDAHPTVLALDASRRFRERVDGDDPAGAFCAEVGRRLLLAELEFSRWILRRVEKVVLDRDRSLSRRITVEFGIRRDAPTFVGSDGRRLRLVPLSMMRRRTLVNLDIRDDGGRTVPMPGIRLTQQLDEAVVLASVAATRPDLAADEACRAWVHRAISGSLADVLAAYASFDGDEDSEPAPFLDELRSDDLFAVTMNRFRTNFTLYIFLPESDGDALCSADHRMIRIGFEEPIRWRYQTPYLQPSDAVGDVWNYRAGRPRNWQLRRGLAALGIEPIRLRLQIPGAEHAASYHFEMTAPPGVQIVGATLLAGRPNEKSEASTIDSVEGHVASVGLHGVEIPSVSLCRVQVDLRPVAEGWLATMLVACSVICAVLGSVAYQWWPGDPGWDKDQITNIIVLLVAVSAGVTTLVAQRHGTDVSARFVTAARALGTVAMALPVAIAGLLVYAGLAPGRAEHAAERWAVLLLCAASVIPLAAIASAWLASVRADQKGELASPWDMTDHPGARELARAQRSASYEALRHRYGFDSPAVGVQSAEGWCEVYAWTDAKHRQAVRSLSPDSWPFPLGSCARLGTECSRLHACPKREPATNGGQPRTAVGIARRRFGRFRTP